MDLLLVLVAGLVALWLVAFVRRPATRFWRAVHAEPEIAMTWMLQNEERWRFGPDSPGAEWTGPFRLCMSPFGFAKLWGRQATLRNSQAEFLALLDSMDPAEKARVAQTFRESTGINSNDHDSVSIRTAIGRLAPLRHCGLSRAHEAAIATRSKDDARSVRERARAGRMPLGQAVRVLLPHYVAVEGKRRRRADLGVRASCATWIMLAEDEKIENDAPRDARTRLLNAWLKEYSPAEDPVACGAASVGSVTASDAVSRIHDTHNVRVDTWREQARAGDLNPGLLQDLMGDFTIRVLQDASNGGSFADVAEHPPGDYVLDRFWDWLHDDPLLHSTDPKLRWRPSTP